MDIHIQGSHDGIELADIIHKSHSTPIIFITSLQDDLTFARASRTNPINFLLKPFQDIQLQRAIELCVKKLDQPDSPQKEVKEEWENDFLFEEFFFIKTRQKLEKVSINQVLYLESDGHYCQVYTDTKKFLIRSSLSELEKRLPIDIFIQTHRSFIVNINMIDTVDLQDSVIIIKDKHIPISKRKREALLKRLDWI